ncbi:MULTISPECIES: fructosamine kinase family protein [Nocardiopsis]|uniref:Fructosamine kinase n=1 Tax=Nocardiopsis sinuspersici TaxID=501010 RepID=A0A1V3BVZ8_9ACTN|nr:MULTISPECIES: fructosamine kinase family protein [Nocardiopsis]NYH53882.1 fructosamine-3-kinase [Nocardiopsis sinuspersici]OOC52794.1 fructosamine kinase [Nocardiopsis sinuspersici]
MRAFGGGDDGDGHGERRPRDPVSGTMAERLSVLLDRDVGRAVRAGSSHDWDISYAELTDGTRLFVKALPRGAPPSGVLTAEARGLEWLGRTFGSPAIDVLAWDERILVLPWMEEREPTAQAAERLGHRLAGMHMTGADHFGADWPGYIGPLPMDNTPSDDWPRFYAEQRLRPYLRRALDQGALTPSDVRVVEKVVDAVPDLAGDPGPPARVHGDLWSGNVLWRERDAVLIDPAAHGGHREADLAMLALFGLPHLERVRDAYNEAAPLASGWRSRVALHQLHPLLVHVCLFGAAYRTTTLEAARTALRGG